jgi:hypothetical protein
MSNQCFTSCPSFALVMLQDVKINAKCREVMNFLCFQLSSEQRGGRVFPGWNEGRIYFPPTYKYSNNSDKYAGDDMNQKEKKRTPAW